MLCKTEWLSTAFMIYSDYINKISFINRRGKPLF